MLQNHLLQLLSLTAMEPPSKFDPDAVRDEMMNALPLDVPLKIDVSWGDNWLAAGGYAQS